MIIPVIIRDIGWWGGEWRAEVEIDGKRQYVVLAKDAIQDLVQDAVDLRALGVTHVQTRVDSV